MKEKYEYTTYDPVEFTPTKHKLDINKVIVEVINDAFKHVNGVELSGVFIDPKTKGIHFNVVEDLDGVQTLTNYIRIEPREYSLTNSLV